MDSNKLYNHEATLHKQFVKDTIALVPEGGNYKDLPKGVGDSRKFNEVVMSNEAPSILHRERHVQVFANILPVDGEPSFELNP